MNPKKLFLILSNAEALTWTGLILAMIAKYAFGQEQYVPIAGGLHGFVFLSYCTITVFVWVNENWKKRTLALGLLCAIVPYATIFFERKLIKQNRLSTKWRMLEKDAKPQNIAEKFQRWLLLHSGLAISLALVLIVIIFFILLKLGPPIPSS